MHAGAQDIGRGVTLSFARADGDVALYLWPRGSGYTFAADLRPAGQGPWQALVEPADVGADEAGRIARGVPQGTSARVHVELPASLHLEPATVAAGAPSTLTLELASTTGATLVRPLTLELPPGVTLAALPALGGTCAATVRAAPGASEITLDRGSVIRRGRCDVSARVVARAPGVFIFTLAAGSVLGDGGTNASPAGATLIAGP